MVENGDFVKVIGLTFDCLEGIEVIDDVNVRSHREAGKFVEDHCTENKIFITVPCKFTYRK